MNRHQLVHPILIVGALALAACSSTGGKQAGADTTTAALSTTVATSTTSAASTTSAVAATTIAVTVPAPTTPLPPPTAAPRPAATNAPVTAPPVTAASAPQLSSVRLRDYTNGVVCTVGTDITIVLSFAAVNAAGVTVWSSTAGNIGQFPAESGEAEVPYTCDGFQTLFTLYPVADGGALGSPIDFSV